MTRLLGLLLAAALVGLLPFALAQEPAKEPRVVPEAPRPGAALFERFDLDRNGKVDWDEYRKVLSGFAALDADRDGFLTPAEFARFAEMRRERVRDAWRHRGMHRMRPGMRGPRFPEGRESMGPRGRGPMGPGAWQRGGRGMGWGFGAGPWGEPPPRPRR